MIEQMASHSIMGRAAAAGHICVNAVNIRDFAVNKYGQVDDAPYGGGAGMVLMAPPVHDAWKSVCKGAACTCGAAECGHCSDTATTRPPRTIYLTPQGRKFSQELAQELARERTLNLLCGHYEGIDQRVLDEIVTDEISIGDFVLTGGEPAALVVMDAVTRLVPGVLGKEASHLDESFSQALDGGLEYPHYTRPLEFNGKNVPEVLLSGHHGKIAEWRLAQSRERTRTRRPDLFLRLGAE
jgi:tRNA (guanine37-N1)-methyltransferase